MRLQPRPYSAVFFAIVQAMNHQFETAAIAIFASLVLDGMDGRIAND